VIGLLEQLSPYWNWRGYYYQDCLVANTPRYPREFHKPSCTLCEDISSIDVVANASSRLIMNQYLNQELPVIVSDGVLDWGVFTDADFSLKNIIKVM